MSRQGTTINNPRLFVVSGPSGVGKDTLLDLVLKERPDLRPTVSATTRPPRPGEKDGVSYHFMSNEEFDRLVGEGAFLEWATYGKNRYGTLNSELAARFAAGSSVVLEIEVQGAMNVRRTRPDAVLIFIEPPSLEELRRRLEGRNTESPEDLERRLSRAEEELAFANRYDERIINDDLEAAANRLLSTIESYER